MELFNIDFEPFRLKRFETEKSQIFEEMEQLAQLYDLGIEKRRYELYEKEQLILVKTFEDAIPERPTGKKCVSI